MQCSSCGNELVRGFTFCTNCGLPVPDEMLKESGLPTRHIDGIKIENNNAPNPADAIIEEEHVGDLVPQLHGTGEEDRGKALKPKLIGGDDENDVGKDLKPRYIGGGEDAQGEALKPQYVGGGDEDEAGEGEKVRAVLQESSSSSEEATAEKLVFCPYCGMHMQRNPNKCEKCGMRLESRPDNVPVTQSGIPLFNVDGDPFSDEFAGLGGGFGSVGGFGGFGGDIIPISDMPDISNEDAQRIENFVNSGSSAGDGVSLFNTQSDVSDFAQLAEQLASFSAGAMQSIQAAENTRIRQKEPVRGAKRDVDDFKMDDDLSSETIPLAGESVRIMGDYSMEENHALDINLDPYAFIHNSMDEEPEQEPEPETFEMPSLQPMKKQAGGAVPNIMMAAAASDNSVPQSSFEERISVKPPTRLTDDEPIEETPFIEESNPMKAPEARPEPRLEDINEPPAPPPKLRNMPGENVKVTGIAADTKSAPKAPPPKPETTPAAAPTPKAEPKPEPKLEAKSEPKPESKPEPKPAPAAAVKDEPKPAAAQEDKQAAPSEPEKAPAAEVKRETPAARPHFAPPPEELKRCVCGRSMAITDKYCPSCGRSMYGAQPQKEENKKPPIALFAIIGVLAAIILLYVVLRFTGTDLLGALSAMLDTGFPIDEIGS